MHTIHTTPGFIIDSKPYGEAGKILWIFTRDFGLVVATAQGIRLEKSKLRYFCQDRSFGEFSLVRGKEYWRLVSASSSEALWINEAEHRSSEALFARIVLLLRRLVQGEEAHPELFDHISALNDFCISGKGLSLDELSVLESLSVFRILGLLGYIGTDDDMASFMPGPAITKDLLVEASKKRIALNKHINKALKESHL